MATFDRFEEIEAWQPARRFTAAIHARARRGPFDRDFAGRDQIRRAANSIRSHTAEGYESRTRALFIDLLGRAKGSSAAVRSQLYVAPDAGYLTETELVARRDDGRALQSQDSTFDRLSLESGQRSMLPALLQPATFQPAT